MNGTPGGDPEHPAAARRERDRGRRPHQAAPAAAPAPPCRRRSRSTVLTDRTATIRASVRGRAVRADAVGRAGRAGHLPVPAQRRRAPLIPAVAVPLSLVGTFGAMYLLGFSLNNLSLMALTISTGFVVDDAIVMIENIARYVEAGESPLEAALKGARADRLHHPVPDRLADRGAHPAALHGRRGRPPVPRVRDHPRRHDPDLGGRVADADPDDVRPAAPPHARPSGRAGSTVVRARVRPDHRGLRHEPSLGARRTRRRRSRSRSPRSALTVVLYVVRPEGLLPGAGHRRHPGHLGGAAVDLVSGDGRAAAGAGRGDPRGSGGREPVLVHRRRRHQRHAQQRAHPDQPEAARPARGERDRRHPPPAARSWRGSRASSSSCSRCRTSPSRTG